MVLNNIERLLNFREDDVRYIMQSLLACKSCALVGVDGAGKSSVMRHLVSAPVREHYLGEKKDNFGFLFIDSRELAKPSSLAYYRRMAALLESVGVPRSIAHTMENHHSLTDEESARQLLFDRVDTLLARREEFVLVFFFDEFDIAFTEVEPHFLRVLQALRRRADRRVCYVVASNNLPGLVCDLHSRRMVRDMFSELFDGNVRGIGPLEERDVQSAIERGLAGRGRDCSAELRRFFYAVTGSHAGMLKAVVGAFAEGKLELDAQEPKERILERLLNDASIFNKCEQLWNHLSESEQQCLKYMREGAVARTTLLQHLAAREVDEALHSLLLKGVLVADGYTGKVYRCFSPLFAFYLVRHVITVSPGLELDPTRLRVWVDGVMQTERLTAKEIKLLRFLALHAGEVCPREETTNAVYGELYNPERDNARLDALVERTRKKIGDDSRSPRFLETIRGMGHRLNEYLGERI